MATTNIRDSFLQTLQDHATTAEAQSKALQNSGAFAQRKIQNAGFDARDPQTATQILQTRDVGNDVADAVRYGSANPNSQADLASSAVQGDYVAAARRAFVLRHAGFVRLAGHAAARLAGQSHERGPLLAGVMSLVQVLVRASKTK